MSNYTTEVRFICEMYAGEKSSKNYLGVDEVIQLAIPKIFDFEFPIFDENYRNVLETKILLHYYTREIGLETVGLWKLKLRTKLNEIMPYYNQLYKSETLEFNPLYDFSYTRDYERTGTNTGTVDTEGNASSDNTHSDAFSDTPQGGLEGVDDLEYLTNYRKIEDSGSNSSGSTVTNNLANTDQYLEHVAGKRNDENYSKLLSDYRKTFLNIDMDIINELKDLFMQIW